MNALWNLFLLILLLNATLNESKKNCKPKFNFCKNSLCTCPKGLKPNKDKSCCVPICENKCIGGKCVDVNKCKCLPGHTATNVPFVCEPFCSNCTNGYCYGHEKCATYRRGEKYSKPEKNFKCGSDVLLTNLLRDNTDSPLVTDSEIINTTKLPQVQEHLTDISQKSRSSSVSSENHGESIAGSTENHNTILSFEEATTKTPLKGKILEITQTNKPSDKIFGIWTTVSESGTINTKEPTENKSTFSNEIAETQKLSNFSLDKTTDFPHESISSSASENRGKNIAGSIETQSPNDNTILPFEKATTNTPLKEKILEINHTTEQSDQIVNLWTTIRHPVSEIEAINTKESIKNLLKFLKRKAETTTDLPQKLSSSANENEKEIFAGSTKVQPWNFEHFKDQSNENLALYLANILSHSAEIKVAPTTTDKNIETLMTEQNLLHVKTSGIPQDVTSFEEAKLSTFSSRTGFSELAAETSSDSYKRIKMAALPTGIGILIGSLIVVLIVAGKHYRNHQTYTILQE